MRRLPYLGQIPILGYLFKRRHTVDSTTELIIYLRPVILYPEDQYLPEYFDQKKFKSETEIGKGDQNQEKVP